MTFVNRCSACGQSTGAFSTPYRHVDGGDCINALIRRVRELEQPAPVSATEPEEIKREFAGVPITTGGLCTVNTDAMAREIISLRARLAEAEANAKRIDAACLAACPDNSPATCEPVEDCPRYFVVGENGHDIICTDDPAEVIKGLNELWREMSELAEARGVRMESAEARLAEAERVTEGQVERAAQSLHWHVVGYLWDNDTESERDNTREIARAALTAARGGG